MAKIIYKQSVIPVVSLPAETYQDNATRDTIAYEVGRRIAGEGDITTTFADVYGFDNGDVQYQDSGLNYSGPQSFYPPQAAYKFLHIKNTGCDYLSVSELGEDNPYDLYIIMTIGLVEYVISSALSTGESFDLAVGDDIDFGTNAIGFRVALLYDDGGFYLDTGTSTNDSGPYIGTVVDFLDEGTYLVNRAVEILATT